MVYIALVYNNIIITIVVHDQNVHDWYVHVFAKQITYSVEYIYLCLLGYKLVSYSPSFSFDPPTHWDRIYRYSLYSWYVPVEYSYTL